MKRKLLGFFLILSTGLSGAEAQTPRAVLRGVVTDATTQRPLPGATVYVVDYERGVTTDADGRFQLVDLLPGRLHLQVSFVGYVTQTRTLTLTGDTVLDVALAPGTISIAEVVVSGGYVSERDRSPIPIETFRPRQMADAGAVTLAEGLTQVPGVSLLPFGSGIGKPVIRGLSFSRILTLYQGTRFENQQWGADHGLGLNDFGVDRIEIIKGPASLIYGSGAVGGVLNVIDERPPLPGEVAGDYLLTGLHNSAGLRSSLGLRGTTENGFYWRIRGGVESHADYRDGEDRTVGNSRFSTYTLKSTVGLRKAWGHTMLNYTYHRQRLGIIEEDEYEESLATTRFDRRMQLPFQDVADHVLSSQTQLWVGQGRLVANLTYHLNDRAEIEDAFDAVDLGLRQQNFTYDLRYYFPTWRKAELMVGTQGFQLENRNFDNAEEILIPDGRLQDYSVFGLVRREWDRVQLEGGLRYDYRTTRAEARRPVLVDYGFTLPGNPADRTLLRTFGGVSGSLGAVYQPSTRWQWRANLATGFRAPDLAELFSNGPHPGTNRFEIGNADFAREQNLQFDLSQRYRARQWSVEWGAFINEIDNYVFFTPTDERRDDLIVFRFEQANARLYGGEIGAALHPTAFPWLSLRSDLSLVRGQRTDTDTPLPLIPAFRFNHTLRAQATGHRGVWHQPFVQAQLRQVLAQRCIDPQEIETPGYQLLSLGVGNTWQLGNLSLETRLVGTNLFNVGYVDHLSVLRPFGIQQMGRNLMLEARIGF